MNYVADLTLTGLAADDQFGISVSTAGDVNGDGYSDIIVGANLNYAAGTDAGSAYIYFGGSIPDNTADETNNILEYWYSGILSGRSIDNIAPLMVSTFNAFSESNNIRLNCKKNTEPDLYN
ncbi:MAG TPA: integrin alpha [Ignavibacteria bacterium]|nr:integrin alpha [Ignavibacteria bacterium]